MRYHVIIILAVILFSVSSCAQKTSDDYNNHQFVEEGQNSRTIEYDSYYFDFSVDNDNIYLLGNDNVEVYRDKVGNIMNYTDQTGIAISAYNNLVALLREDEIILCDENGKTIKTYPLNNIDNIEKFNDIIMNEQYIIFYGVESDLDYIHHRVFCISRKDDKMTEISDLNKNKTVYFINGISFIDKERLVVTAKITLDYFTDNNIIATFDLSKKQLVYERELPHASDVSQSNGYIYYGDEMKVYRYSETDHVSTVIRSYKKDMILSDSDKDISINNRKLLVTSQNIIYLFPTSKTIYIDRLKYEMDPVRIIAPISEKLYERFEDEILSFTMETRVPVEVTELPDENYLDKLNLKLMAHDHDFDLFFLTHIDKNQTLQGILDKKFYLPLNDYSAVKNIFKGMYRGIQDIMTCNEDIYGVPVSFTYIPLLVNESVFQKYNIQLPNKMEWTFKDLWELCEQLKAMDSNVRVFSNDIDLLGAMLRIWGELYHEDTDHLIELIHNFRKYMECQVLAFENGDLSQYDYHENENYLFKTFHEYIMPYSDMVNKNVNKWPVISADDPVVCNLSKAFLVNRNTLNRDIVVRLLLFIYQSHEFDLFYQDDMDAPCQEVLAGGAPILKMNTDLVDNLLKYLADNIYDKSVSDEEICDHLRDQINYSING